MERRVGIRYCVDFRDPNALSILIGVLEINEENSVTHTCVSTVDLPRLCAERYEELPGIFERELQREENGGKSIAEVVRRANARLGATFHFEVVP